MQTEPDSPFEMLEPPPGGVERMRARFAAPGPAQRGFAIAWAGLAAVAVLVALLVVAFTERQSRNATDDALLASHELDRLLGRETPPAPLTVERDGREVQTEQVPSADPRVRIYRML